MSSLARLLLLAALFAAVSCQQVNGREADVCKGTDKTHVCSVPFEVVFSDREALIGRNVELQGVLVVGTRPEPPGSQTPVMLLFSSTERAKICSPEFAIELVASKEVVRELENINGSTVSVAGQLKLSPRGHWSQLDVVTAPTLLHGEKGRFECMTAPPPPPPEPAS